jgi:hypothetical protein
MGCGGAIAGAGFRVLPDLNNLRKKLSGGTSDDSDKPEELDTAEGTSEPFDTFEKTALEGLDPTEGIDTFEKTVLEGLDPTEGIDTFDKTALDPTDGLDVSEKTDWFNVGSGGAMRAALANLDFCL